MGYVFRVYSCASGLPQAGVSGIEVGIHTSRLALFSRALGTQSSILGYSGLVLSISGSTLLVALEILSRVG